MAIENYIQRRLKRFLAITLLMFAGSLFALDRVAGALKLQVDAGRAGRPAARR